jgi:flagellar M-ring protein FliF
MKDQILTLAKRLWADFRAFSPGQKAVTIAAALALVVGGFLFLTWKSRPTYAPLYTNLAASDASAIVDKLTSEKIPYQLADAGTEILVPQDKVYSTRLTMSAAGLPDSDQTGYSLLDKEGVTTSQFQQQVDYQRAIEGELAKTIESMNGVQAASVHLALPQQDVFNDGSQKPTAAVMLTTSSGTQLTTQQVQSIVYLVSSSVPQMSPDSVTVTDSAGQVLSAPGSGVTDAAATGTQNQATQDYDNQLSTKLESLIDATLGTGHAVVTVNSVLDFDQTKTETNTYLNDPSNPPLSEQEEKETYGNGVTGAGGTLGAGTPATDTTTSNGTTGPYKKTSKTVNNALGTEKQTVVNAPGSVKKLSIAVLLDGTPKTVNVSGIQSLVKSATGFDASRGDSLSVQAMPFNKSAAKAAQKAQAAAAKAAAAKAAHAHMVSLIKQGALAAVILAVVLGTWLASRRRKNGGEPEPQADFGFFPEPDDPILPEPLPEPVVTNTDVNEAINRRRALVAIADEQPDDVARVLSGWLSREV